MQNFKYFCKVSCVPGEREGCGCVKSRRDDGLRSTAFGELSVGLTTVTAVGLERQLHFLFVLRLHKPHLLASLLVVLQVWRTCSAQEKLLHICLETTCQLLEPRIWDFKKINKMLPSCVHKAVLQWDQNNICHIFVLFNENLRSVDRPCLS